MNRYFSLAEIFELKPVESMDKAKRYLAVQDCSGSNDSDTFCVVFWSRFASDWMSSEKSVIQASFSVAPEKWKGTKLKGWVLELPQMKDDGSIARVKRLYRESIRMGLDTDVCSVSRAHRTWCEKTYHGSFKLALNEGRSEACLYTMTWLWAHSKKWLR